jgi:PAS domain S-box-containing protein
VEADICMQLQNQSKKVENASSLALENLSNIINSNSSPTLVINNQNKVKLANQAFKKIFNYSHNSIGNQNISKIFSKEFKFDSSKVDYWNARKDLTIKNGNNRQIPIDLKINQLSYNGENYFVFVIRDIRKIKAFQRKIMHQNKKLQDIAWMHSHIMRQPVTNILAIINAVEASEKLEDKLECINLLKECSNQFDSLVKKVFEKTGSKSIVN